jgi:formylglycine-generating enzyme required for sulfatase activity
VAAAPAYFGTWLEGFRPARAQLATPLAAIFRNPRRREADRSRSTDLLARYATDRPDLLANLLMDADDKQFAVLLPKVRDRAEQAVSYLHAELDRTAAPGEAREALAKRQANAAVALLRINRPAKVWPLLRHSRDPGLRSRLIHRLSPLGADAEAIIKRLDVEPDVTIQRVLLLSLGEFGEKELPLVTRRALVPRLQNIYRTAADPGLHAAAEWLLRTWKQEAWLQKINDEWATDEGQRKKRLESIRQLLARDREKAALQWYVNIGGQTMVVMPGPVEFKMGSPPTESRRKPDETQHRKRIGRTFALAAAPVTNEQYMRPLAKFAPQDRNRLGDPACPVAGVSWYLAAVYCNALSGLEGVPHDQWCYELDAQGKVAKLKANYLSLTGYRLPTEAEWEYACRAGAVTRRYYGEADELLARYSWSGDNKPQTWPVGSKKPNDLGFFDMQGNVYTWCQETYRDYPTPTDDMAIDDREDDLNIVPTTNRVLRGGSNFSPGWLVRCAYRLPMLPTASFPNIGFRPARTLYGTGANRSGILAPP